MSEWKPIETAPKDGTRILFYDPGYFEKYRIRIVWWDTIAKQWQEADSEMISPTHWMPLPEPPK